ncbi:hypothetical protein ACFL55_01445, partial [Candidatus Latescibacterota bacterium]
IGSDVKISKALKNKAIDKMERFTQDQLDLKKTYLEKWLARIGTSSQLGKPFITKFETDELIEVISENQNYCSWYYSNY